MVARFNFKQNNFMSKTTIKNQTQLQVQYLTISELKPADYNPRVWDSLAIEHLTESIKKFGLVVPIICNIAPSRKNVVIGGHFRLKIAKDLGLAEVPVVYVNIPNLDKEQELNLRLNRNTGAWDFEKLKEFNINTLL